MHRQFVSFILFVSFASVPHQSNALCLSFSRRRPNNVPRQQHLTKSSLPFAKRLTTAGSVVGSSSGGSTATRLQSSTSSFIEDDEDEIQAPANDVPADMRYIPFNILRQVDNFKKIRDVGGKDTVNDVYVRDPNTSTFWFSGKIARCTGTVTLEEAVARQWHLIEQHAARLRLSRGNNELGPKFGELEIWVAPGDSELDVAYNRPSCTFLKMPRVVEGVFETVKNAEVGYEGEIYTDDEEGFRTERDEEGRPVKPEITGEVNTEKKDATEEFFNSLGLEKNLD